MQKKLANFLKSVREDADISEARIPVIIYTGPPSELPTVFEYLNSQGTALSRYEIFAAQWIDYRQPIQNNNIINAIWKKYEALEDEGFTLDISEQAPDSRSRREREYTLFEYLFGLGQYLSSKYSRLFRSVAADRPSSAGFNLVSACVGLNVKDMDKLPAHIQELDRSKLENCILESTEFVDNILKSVISVKQHGRNTISIYHSEFQITSMVATAFQIRYNIEDLSEIGGWSSNRKKLEKNLLMFYLYDIMRDYWRGSGDTKLHDNVNNLRYLNNPPSQSYWLQVLDTWFVDNQISLLHTKRYVRDQTPEILLLKYIYAHKLSVMKNAKTYHVEHIIPVDQLVSLMTEKEKWPINNISNLALLEDIENIKKKDRTFVEYLDKKLASNKLSEDEYKFELNIYEDQLICKANLLPNPINKDTYEDFLLKRFDVLKSEFIKVWKDNISQEPVLDETS